ncbi:MAG: undecaprenyldiphospho-muramoylpentapeptide beta-N-acetylglucosaminyltransferase [Ignavibacteriaceae bacterium]|jgi:UDP-N-acetylglucosamine--N-acetylmuramyl-(pentapeptide) pyrophosphoryl-undecaprenol N-acetylglucosamine transferase
MSTENKKYRFLFAGGGTGGHLFPAVAVAERIKIKLPNAQIMFVGTKSKIESKVIPELGYKFKSIWIKGFSRKINFENLLFPLKVIVSVIQSIFINLNFKPQVAIGSGGYVAGPAIFASSLFGAKIILLEQNSYPGVTSKMLEKFADEIHVGFEDSKKYFKNKEKIFFTGNPVRKNLGSINKNDALKEFNLSDSKKTLLIVGGSLGAGSINDAVAGSLKKLEENQIQVIWQTGKNYYEKYRIFTSPNILVMPFIVKMDIAYSACDLMLARAGATTIAELLTLGIPSILVPSPNVTENHQYYNAKSLSEKNAAILMEDKILSSKLTDEVLSIIFNPEKLLQLKMNALLLSKPDAAEEIAARAIKYAVEV